MQLSNRLYAVASMVTPGNIVVDVGTDHGYIPIYLVEKNIISRAIAMDINIGPLKRADQHIKDFHMENYIETRLSDGVASLKKGEGDTLIIAGMGGSLVIKILKEGKTVLGNMKELILQPQSEIFLVRKFLQKEGYLIQNENIILEDGKYYSIIKAIKGKMNYDKEIYYKYGKLLLESKNPVLKMFLDGEYNTCLKIIDNLTNHGQASIQVSRRKKEIEIEMQQIIAAKEYYFNEVTNEML